ncbi:phage tail assembly protein T [Mixta calida]|uniref:phage tail assembly protein T n=1 Tax=Mixta calida TaxID=665913 RepID=UPI003CEC1180
MMRTEWAAGMVSSTIANVNRGERTPAYSVADFTLHFNRQPASNEPIELGEAMKSWI